MAAGEILRLDKTNHALEYDIPRPQFPYIVFHVCNFAGFDNIYVLSDSERISRQTRISPWKSSYPYMMKN